MSYFYLFFSISIILNIGSTEANGVIRPCKLTDQACIEESINAAAPHILDGIPSLGIDSSDPLFIELVEGNLSILKYKFINATLIGLKKCKVHNIRINLEKSSLKFDLDCPHFEETGYYEIDGRLIILHVEGAGDFTLTTENAINNCPKMYYKAEFKTPKHEGRYLVSFDAELKKNQRDGKTYVTIKNFKSTLKPVEPLYFDFKNLFNGQKELSDAVHNFAHSNWQEVADLVQESAFLPVLKKLSSHVNKYLKTISLEEMILN